MTDNFVIVLFKNKIKKKIINKFKTKRRANNFYNKLVKESDNVKFDKQFDNGNHSFYEIALLERKSGSENQMYKVDSFGRQVKVDLDDSEYRISKIQDYHIEDSIVDYQTKKKITFTEFLDLYMSSIESKMVSKLNNKIVLQIDNDYKLFTLKNLEDSSRFIDCLIQYFIDNNRGDALFVKDYSTVQRKYLYDLLTEKGFPKDYLFRHSTTHSVRK